MANPEGSENVSDRRFFNFSLHWKITASFVILFSIVFGFVAIWVIQFSANVAQERLASQLVQHVEGASLNIDGDAFAELVATVPPAPDPSNDTGLGYPDSDLYRSIAKTLFDVRRVVNAGTYTWFKSPEDGKMYTAVSSGYLLDPPTGYTFKVPVAEVAPQETYDYMEQGLQETTQQPAYTDDYGSWMSAYTPIRDSQGNVVGGVGQDYALDYVAEVRASAIRQVLPVLVISYLVLVGLVLIISRSIVRPLKRLTVDATRISDGEYSIDLSSLMRSRFRDEIYDLADAFKIMAGKIAAREQSLRSEVRRLKVEIDHAKRTEAVREITESDDFASIAERAAEMRRRMRGDSAE